MSKKKSRYIVLLILVIAISLILTGCISTKEYQTKPDYDITEQVTLSFMNYYSQGEIERAMEHVAGDAILSTDSGQMEGKEVIEEIIKLNIEKDNGIEILEKQKIDESKITLIVANKIPLFQISGIDIIKTKEKFEVQDGKIVRWEIQHLKESVDTIERVAVGTTGLEASVQDGKIVVTNILDNSPAKNTDIQIGDIILSIEGVELKDMTYGEEEIPYRLIGEVGSRVNLEIKQGTETSEVRLRRVHISDL